jgi:hypothetical protein
VLEYHENASTIKSELDGTLKVRLTVQPPYNKWWP